MHFLALIFWIFSAAASDGIYNAKCNKDTDCIGHLTCSKKKCSTPGKPSKKTCAEFSYRQETQKGELIAQCPPDCGFKKDLLYGPMCVLNKTGCAASADCREQGICGFNGSSCIKTEEGCAKSKICLLKGLCGFDGKHCVPSRQGCSKSVTCKQEGRCGYMPGPAGYEASHGRCEITEKGCAASQICRSSGKCGFHGDICITTKMGCTNSDSCKKERKCRYKKYVGCIR